MVGRGVQSNRTRGDEAIDCGCNNVLEVSSLLGFSLHFEVQLRSRVCVLPRPSPHVCSLTRTAPICGSLHTAGQFLFKYFNSIILAIGEENSGTYKGNKVPPYSERQSHAIFYNIVLSLCSTSFFDLHFLILCEGVILHLV